MRTRHERSEAAGPARMRVWRSALAVVLAASAIGGCTLAMSGGIKPQSHFDFPNSNVFPVRSVSGSSAAKLTIMTPASLDGRMERAAIDDALSKVADADMLINYHTELRQTMIPIPGTGITIFSTRVVVDGVAARTEEIGTQILD